MNREYKEVLNKSGAAKNKAKEIAGKISDERKRAQSIYQFIQQNVASSDLRGVFLLRPVDEVLESKRGDPDEINALFVTMLREAKLDADLVLVASRNWQTLAFKFPNFSQFSKIITRINFKQGAVVVDASNPASPFGSLPWFEQGIPGLVAKSGRMEQRIC